jgi:hypothetical protein
VLSDPYHALVEGACITWPPRIGVVSDLSPRRPLYQAKLHPGRGA